jgi:pyrroline-5-carboxylate reductase
LDSTVTYVHERVQSAATFAQRETLSYRISPLPHESVKALSDGPPEPVSGRKQPMKLGFVGTGEITSAIVAGLSSSSAEYKSIRVSPRNPEMAAELAKRFAAVSVASSNQDVVDSSEVVVLAVRPSTAQSIISKLRFRADHCLISLVAGLSLRRLSELVAPAMRIVRAVPLPSTARRTGPTVICPADQIANDLFARIGTVFPVETEHELNAMSAATATMASVYALMEKIAAWLAENGIPDQRAREYIAQVFCGMFCAAVDEPDRSFRSFAKAHATAGGINEQFLKHVTDSGLFDGIPDGLTAVMKRISTT